MRLSLIFLTNLSVWKILTKEDFVMEELWKLKYVPTIHVDIYLYPEVGWKRSLCKVQDIIPTIG
jgi:hypothetical protein